MNHFELIENREVSHSIGVFRPC